MKTIAEIGEKEVIEKIISTLDLMPKMPIPFGDDVSAVQLDNNMLAVLKTDMLVRETDVPSGVSLRQAARKAIVMNVSDFAAKGVQPLAFLISIGLPLSITEEDLEEIGLGLNEAAREYGAFIIGGDTNETSDLIISCSLLGLCNKRNLVKRSGAQPGDIVAVTGEFGKTTAGLKILLGNISDPESLLIPLITAVSMPKARLKEGLALAQLGTLTSSIDSSDGLAWSLYELAESSNVGFEIDNIPMAPEAVEFAKAHGLDIYDLGLYGGEEYEIVVTLHPESWEKTVKVVKAVGGMLIKIGTVTENQLLTIRKNGEKKLIERRGWEHFKKQVFVH